ncbi:hypothetical protein WR164_02470 [Philodulcilactobacillus myokoensis]|uniref:DUF805 domain-containing protein n=1 Tax=Philodulcilactobacillus myokoensis TaxID=2929573 RepID=A0A9W6ESE9_9LACO|nr:DUF805 domain-containing protein [Philodulcilactobacillus myokoensis]GLB46268.1 hypothetical protein WR164_02470 [Philodulcilactobacillus myokoensis]
MQRPNHGYVGFLKAYGMYWKNYFNFSGNSSRSEYWWTFLWNTIIGIVISIPMLISLISMFAQFEHNNYSLSGVSIFSLIMILIYFIWGLANLIPQISLTVRRYHDVNFSGWWYILTPLLASRLAIISTHNWTAVVIRTIGFILLAFFFYLLIKNPVRTNNKYIKNN